ncbi:hypothetical protein [Actinomadura sp. SCN-SB]|uniref:hypothetical protein n=1 Tax=Actinomadura sp. SCN-SB TaxID=3373092 RepID=UPI00375112A4
MDGYLVRSDSSWFGGSELIASFSVLLPSERQGVPGELWDAGERGLAVEMLADNLAEQHQPLRRSERLSLLALAELWAVGDQARGALRWCPDPDIEDQPWKVVEDTERAWNITIELGTEIAVGHALHGRDLTVWLACNACDDTLVRIDDRQAQVGVTPYQCAIVHPTWSGHAEHPPWPSTPLYSNSRQALDHLERRFS